MDRAKFLQLAGLTETSLTTLGHRKLLPFVPRRASPKAWAEYTVKDAVLTLCMLELTDRGEERKIACALVREVADDLWGLMEGGGSALSSPLIGLIRIKSEPVDPDEPAAVLTHPIACLLHDVPKKIEGLRERIRGSLSYGFVEVAGRVALVEARAKRGGFFDELAGELAQIGGTQ